MRHLFVVGLLVVGLASPGLSIECFAGSMADEELVPEEDFDKSENSNICGDENENLAASNAVCVKTRLEYSGQFISFYYCEDSWAEPSSQYADFFPVLPAPTEDECESEDDIQVYPDLIVLEDEDDEVHADYCTCNNEHYCNGADIAAAAAATVLALSLAVAATFAA